MKPTTLRVSFRLHAKTPAETNLVGYLQPQFLKLRVTGGSYLSPVEDVVGNGWVENSPPPTTDQSPRAPVFVDRYLERHHDISFSGTVEAVAELNRNPIALCSLFAPKPLTPEEVAAAAAATAAAATIAAPVAAAPAKGGKAAAAPAKGVPAAAADVSSSSSSSLPSTPYEPKYGTLLDLSPLLIDAHAVVMSNIEVHFDHDPTVRNISVSVSIADPSEGALLTQEVADKLMPIRLNLHGVKNFPPDNTTLASTYKRTLGRGSTGLETDQIDVFAPVARPPAPTIRRGGGGSEVMSMTSHPMQTAAASASAVPPVVAATAASAGAVKAPTPKTSPRGAAAAAVPAVVVVPVPKPAAYPPTHGCFMVGHVMIGGVRRTLVSTVTTPQRGGRGGRMATRSMNMDGTMGFKDGGGDSDDSSDDDDDVHQSTLGGTANDFISSSSSSSSSSCGGHVPTHLSTVILIGLILWSPQHIAASSSSFPPFSSSSPHYLNTINLLRESIVSTYQNVEVHTGTSTLLQAYSQEDVLICTEAMLHANNGGSPSSPAPSSSTSRPTTAGTASTVTTAASGSSSGGSSVTSASSTASSSSSSSSSTMVSLTPSNQQLSHCDSILFDKLMHRMHTFVRNQPHGLAHIKLTQLLDTSPLLQKAFESRKIHGPKLPPPPPPTNSTNPSSRPSTSLSNSSSTPSVTSSKSGGGGKGKKKKGGVDDSIRLDVVEDVDEFVSVTAKDDADVIPVKTVKTPKSRRTAAAASAAAGGGVSSSSSSACSDQPLPFMVSGTRISFSASLCRPLHATLLALQREDELRQSPLFSGQGQGQAGGMGTESWSSSSSRAPSRNSNNSSSRQSLHGAMSDADLHLSPSCPTLPPQSSSSSSTSNAGRGVVGMKRPFDETANVNGMFTRMVIAMQYADDSLLDLISRSVVEVNKHAMPYIQGSLRSYQVQQDDIHHAEEGSLDIVCGFSVIDDDCRIIVLEGLSDGEGRPVRGGGADHDVNTGSSSGCLVPSQPSLRGMTLVRRVIMSELSKRGHGNHPSIIVLANPLIRYNSRQYTLCGLELKRIRLRQPLSLLCERPEVYDAKRLTPECGQCLTMLMRMRACKAAVELQQQQLWPSLYMLGLLESKYGDALSLMDMDGKIAALAAMEAKKNRRRVTMEDAEEVATSSSHGHGGDDGHMIDGTMLTMDRQGESIRGGGVQDDQPSSSSSHPVLISTRNKSFEDHLANRPPAHDYIKERSALVSQAKEAYRQTAVREREEEDKRRSKLSSTLAGLGLGGGGTSAPGGGGGVTAGGGAGMFASSSASNLGSFAGSSVAGGGDGFSSSSSSTPSSSRGNTPHRLLSASSSSSSSASSPQVFPYSSSAMSYVEQEKERLRKKIIRDTDATYTYSSQYLSASISSVNEDAIARQVEQASKQKWMTKGGFVYPPPMSPSERIKHPKRPDDARVQALKVPWTGDEPPVDPPRGSINALPDNQVDFKTLSKHSVYFGGFKPPVYAHEYDRTKIGDYSHLPRGKLISERDDRAFMRSVYVDGGEDEEDEGKESGHDSHDDDNEDGGEKEEVDFGDKRPETYLEKRKKVRKYRGAEYEEKLKELDEAEWKRKVVVDDVCVHVDGLYIKDKTDAIDRTRDILHDKPHSKFLKIVRNTHLPSGKHVPLRTAPLTIINTGEYIDASSQGGPIIITGPGAVDSASTLTFMSSLRKEDRGGFTAKQPDTGASIDFNRYIGPSAGKPKSETLVYRPKSGKAILAASAESIMG